MSDKSLLKYSETTIEDRAKICNGCGGKGGWFNPPEFLFHASCNQHDFYYWRGGDEIARKEADKAFYRFMKVDAEEAGGFLKRKFHRVMAWIYYRAVRWSGKKFFYYGEPRTKEDIKNNNF